MVMGSPFTVAATSLMAAGGAGFGLALTNPPAQSITMVKAKRLGMEDSLCLRVRCRGRKEAVL